MGVSREVGRRDGSPRTAGLPTIDEPSHLSFVLGFPCTRYRCPGTMVEERTGRARVVVCSVCEAAYYRVTVRGL